MMSWKSVTKAIRDRLRPYRLHLWLLTGEELASGESLAVLYAGTVYNKNYFTHRAFRAGHREQSLGRAWLWKAIRLCRDTNAEYSMSILEISRPAYRWLENGKGYYVPCWIDSEQDLTDGVRNLERSGNVKNDLRRIKKNGLDFEITKDAQRFDHFFHHMYLPHVQRVHADATVPISYAQLMEKANHSELLLIKKDDQYIAGDVLVYENGAVFAWCIGVKDGNPDYVKLGALAAVYYYRLLYLHQKGFKGLHLGATRAFLNDGVFQYKRKWGIRVTGDRNLGFWLMPLRLTNGVRRFLVSNPFIYAKDGGWSGAVFQDRESGTPEAESGSLYKSYGTAGVQELVCHSLAGHDDPARIR